jgi:hypothetical protein
MTHLTATLSVEEPAQHAEPDALSPRFGVHGHLPYEHHGGVSGCEIAGEKSSDLALSLGDD